MDPLARSALRVATERPNLAERLRVRACAKFPSLEIYEPTKVDARELDFVQYAQCLTRDQLFITCVDLSFYPICMYYVLRTTAQYDTCPQPTFFLAGRCVPSFLPTLCIGVSGGS